MEVLRNVVVFEREDVKLVENGDVLTGNLMEIAQIKRKPGRFKTEVNFHKDMSSDEVKSVLKENFPLLHNRRFSCAARGTQNSARLEFHGVCRVWDGKTIKSKLKGSSVLYLVMEDEPPVSQEAFCGRESASSMQGHSRYSSDNSENNQQMSQLLTHTATITSSGGTRYKSRANPADNSNLDEDIFGSSLFPGSFDCEMEGDLPQLSPGVLDFLDETGSTQSKRQSQIRLSELYRDVANHCSDLWTGLTIGLTDQTSGPMTYPAFNPPWIGTVGAMPPNAEVLAQSQPYENRVFEASSTDTSPRRESGFSSEESSSMDQAIDLPHSIPREAGVEVKPSKGPLEGGEVFELSFDKSLPDAVTSALATFGNKQVEVWKTYEGGFVLYGKSIPPGEVPGTVLVKITTKNGAYLGKTEFTYVSQYEEKLKQIVQSRSLLSQFFKMLSKQCENDESEENNTQPFGLPSDGRQRQAVDILRCLVYTAAGIGAEEFIRMIFSTSTGRIVFEAYKNESPLPEDIADANGHEEIATFLQAITKRFSEEETTSQTRSEGINWHELARAVEESEEQSVAWRSKKDVKQLKEDDLFEREYFGDGETSSSDSEKERCDNEDQFAARFSEGYPSFVHRLTESDIHSCHLPDDIGKRWKDLARGLGYKEAFITSIESEKDSNKECCITLLVKWMEKEGEQGATWEKLATALTNIGLQNLADRLIGPLNKRVTISMEVEKTIKLDDTHQTQIMLARDSTGRKKFLVWESEENEFETLFEELDNSVNATIQISVNTPDETKVMKTSEVKDLDISEELKRLQEKLSDITSNLEKGELKEESLPIPDKLNLINRHSRTLQEIYTKVTGMTGEACKCDQLVRRTFYDFTYHSLRSVHRDMGACVVDLQEEEATMTEKEKDTLRNLLSYQRGREKQVEHLEKLWIGLFSPIVRAHSEGTLTKGITSRKIVRASSEGALYKGKANRKYAFALPKRKSEGGDASCVLTSFSEAGEEN